MKTSSEEFDDNKLTHELGALLHSLGSDILKNQIKLGACLKMVEIKV